MPFGFMLKMMLNHLFRQSNLKALWTLSDFGFESFTGHLLKLSQGKIVWFKGLPNSLVGGLNYADVEDGFSVCRRESGGGRLVP